MEITFFLKGAKKLTDVTHGYRVLVVDDEELIRNLIVTFLSGLGHRCITASDGVDALKKMKENELHAVVTDIKMQKMDGIILTREILKQYPELPVMVMIESDDEYSAGTAISVGAREFIRKPFSLDEFAIRLHKMVSESKTQESKPMKSDQDLDEGIHDLVNELEAALK
jgi:DNA-binding NtrC family response regulator